MASWVVSENMADYHPFKKGFGAEYVTSKGSNKNNSKASTKKRSSKTKKEWTKRLESAIIIIIIITRSIVFDGCVLIITYELPAVFGID